MKLISMIVEVYNEEKLLPYCLKSMLPFVDECIIIDGSENGPSTDDTSKIVMTYQRQYVDKIIYHSGTFQRDDGAWDDTSQSNKGFELATGKYIMRTHADIVYDYSDMADLRAIVYQYQDYHKVFYCPLIEFFYDVNHIRLYPHSLEELLPRPLVGDVPVIAKSIHPHFEDVGPYRRSGLQSSGFGMDDIIYMPHVKRFHFAWVKPFKDQVLKHVRYIKRGDHEVHGEELKLQGEKAIFDWAIKHVLSYSSDPGMFPYAGEYPAFCLPLVGMTSMDGYEEFMSWYQQVREEEATKVENMA